VLGPDAEYRLGPDAVRRPDVSVILAGRLPASGLEQGRLRIPPDIAVEVLSPNDLASAREAKLTDSLDFGVRLVWIVDPASRTVTVYEADGAARRLRAADALNGGAVLPGFRCAVADLFPPA
jgi:Uma2 family endonuclease